MSSEERAVPGQGDRVDCPGLGHGVVVHRGLDSRGRWWFTVSFDDGVVRVINGADHLITIK